VRFDIISIFPDFFSGPLDYGILRRAREAKLVETKVHDLRAFTHDRHKTVDDRPFGGGEGMVMKPEPLFEAVESLVGASGTGADRLRAGTAIVLLSAAGRLFRQEAARRFAGLERMVLICGRYEGVDERVAEHLATDEISIGDFVLSGGELAAAMVLDAVTRLIPGALGNEDSAVNESFSEVEADTEWARHGSTAPTTSALPLRRDAQSKHAAARRAAPDHLPATSQQSRVVNYGILDYPHYTRPQSFRGWDVPETLRSGNHEEIRRWRRKKAIEKTLRNRPELLDGAKLNDEDQRYRREVEQIAGN
jgi:tRNA (guanine37-N1)-methyltransferase